MIWKSTFNKDQDMDFMFPALQIYVLQIQYMCMVADVSPLKFCKSKDTFVSSYVVLHQERKLSYHIIEILISIYISCHFMQNSCIL